MRKLPVNKWRPLPPDPRYYRKAAERISNGDYVYSCIALKSSLPEYMHIEDYFEYETQYQLMFAPRSRNEYLEHGFWGLRGTPNRQLQRSLALLFMAEMCENP